MIHKSEECWFSLISTEDSYFNNNDCMRIEPAFIVANIRFLLVTVVTCNIFNEVHEEHRVCPCWTLSKIQSELTCFEW